MNSKMNPARVDREDERRMLPCRNYMSGYCAKGSRCRFYHPLPSEIGRIFRVRDFPSRFQQNHFGHFPIHAARHTVFPAGPSPVSGAYFGMNGELGMGMGRPIFHIGIDELRSSNNSRNAPPVSRTYLSEKEMAYAQQMEIQKERIRQAPAPPVSESEENIQNTVFSHINWKEFMAPGVPPPPPTQVPCTSNSSGKYPTNDLDSLKFFRRSAGSSTITCPANLKTSFLPERLAPDLSPTPTSAPLDEKIPSPKLRDVTAHLKSMKPLSAKAEFKMKVLRSLSPKEEFRVKIKRSAKELAAEPAQHAQSLDMFFRNHTFQTTPTAPSSEQDLISRNAPEMIQVTSDNKVETNEEEVIEGSIQSCKSETITLMANKTIIASSDSGISSELGSGDSMDSMKTDSRHRNADEDPNIKKNTES